jgi:hypothetical protein
VKKRRASGTNVSQHRSKLRSDNHLVGTWKQKPNRIHTTPVLYTVTMNHGKFNVSGMDTEDGTLLKISQIRWDGEFLHFVSFYPPTKHRAKHALKTISDRKMRHKITCTFSDGEVYADTEIWLRERSKRRAAPNTRRLPTHTDTK